MNNDPRDRQTDRARDPDLDPIRSAWRRLEHPEPPELLDRAVLNAARRELERPPKYRHLRWLGAFATAAVLVLALVVVMRQDPWGPAAPAPSGDGLRLERSAAAPAHDSPGAAGLQAEQRLLEARDEDSPTPGPEEWIKQMLALRAAGDLQELEAELAAFRRAFPDYPLPDELAD
ncbi:MAG TPA: hypothetical protein VFG48_11840 [Xanthomonadales bacterium]|nr:hypothetical protein [Xanthomonadales bacterium]